jgi:hypothetical protein
MPTKPMFADAVGNHYPVNLGSTAAIASGGANGRLINGFVAPANIKILGVWKNNLAADEVTKGTATTSASYRRTMLRNGGTAGTATTILASLNAQTSAASLGSRGFTLVTTPTASQGDILYFDQLTVGAATADGTDAAACNLQAEYQLI